MTASYAVVTGGTGGLGLEVCKSLIRLKKPVILTARRAEAGKAAAESLESELCRFYQLDVNDESSIEAFVQAVAADLPGQQIDLLVNNAAVLHYEWTKENFDDSIQSNATAPVTLIRALEPQMKDGALIINVSSSMGTKPHILDEDYVKILRNAQSVQDLYSGMTFKEDSPQKKDLATCYSLSKAILSKATSLMAEEPALKERRISLVSVDPGWCRTIMGNTQATDTIKPDNSPEEGAENILWPFKNFKETLNGAFLDERGAQFPDCV